MSTNPWQLEHLARAHRAELERRASSYRSAHSHRSSERPQRRPLVVQVTAHTGELLVRLGTRLVEAAEPDAACCPPPSGSLRLS
ncbi:MAG: hypothetical protein ACRD0B_01455 [Acidimicrobiales bacterium]